MSFNQPNPIVDNSQMEVGRLSNIRVAVKVPAKWYPPR